jgi:hypothetical protein
MSRYIRLNAALLALLAAASAMPAAPAIEENSPLAIVPASAPIVAYVRGVEATKDRLIVTIKKSLPEFGETVEALINKTWTDGTPDGRKLRGLVKNGPAFAVFTELPKAAGEPKMAIILTVTKYSEFRDNVLTEEERKSIKAESGFESATLATGEPIFFVDKKEYAVVTPAKDVAEAFTKKQKGLDGRISKEQAAKLLASDVSLYVNMDDVNKEYADQIKTAKEGAAQQLKTLAESVEKSQRGSLQLMEKMIDPAFQALEDSHGFLFTVEFRPAGFAIHLETELRDGTATAKAIEGNKLSPFKGMDGLPSDQLIYSCLESNKWLTSSLGRMTFGTSIDPDSKEGKALQAAIDEMVKADPGTLVSGFNIPMQGVKITHYGDPSKGLDSELKMLGALLSGASYSGGLLKEKPKVTPKAQKYGDFEFTGVELKWDLEKMSRDAGGSTPLPDEVKKQIAEGLRRFLGEKQTTWIGTDGKVVLQVTASDWAAAEKLLDNYAKGTHSAGTLAAYRDIRKELPAEASAIALVDVVRGVGVILEFTKPILENVIPVPVKLPAAPANVASSYSGGALTLKGRRAGVDLFISATTIHGIYQHYVQPVISGFGAAN